VTSSIQTNWKVVTCGEVVDVRDGTHETPKYVDSGIPLITSKNLKSTGIDFTNVQYISKADHQAISKRSQVDNNDILFAMIGTIGNPVLVEKEREFSIKNTALFKLSGSQVNPKYFLRLLDSSMIRRQLDSATRGGTQKFVSLKVLRGLTFPLPPLPEQKRIAQILDAADALRAKRRESIAQLDALVQSTFLEMFGDPIGNHKEFETKNVAQLCTLVRGSSPRPKGDPAFYGAGVPRLMVADVTRDGFSVTPKIDSLTTEGAKRSRPVPSGTIVMAVSGNVGLVSRVNVNCCIHDGFVGFLKLDEETVDPVYFMYQLHLQKTIHEKIKAGAIFKNITTNDIKRINIQLPKKELQIKFSENIKSIQTQKSHLQTHLTELNTLFASLQSRAFNGEL